MTIADLIRLAVSRLTYLSQRKSAAEQIGDVGAVEVLDAEIDQTEQTLAQLRSLE